jgi:hypothetical protein
MNFLKQCHSLEKINKNMDDSFKFQLNFEIKIKIFFCQIIKKTYDRDQYLQNHTFVVKI